MLLIRPVTLLLAGLALALSPALYFFLGNDLAATLGLSSISEQLLWLWALAATALICGLMVPVSSGSAMPTRVNSDRLYGLLFAYTVLQIVFIGIIYAALGYLPIFRVPEGFDISGMNEELSEFGGFFGLYTILLLPYLGLTAYVLTRPSQGIAGRLGKTVLGLFAIFIALQMAKMQPLAILMVATGVFGIFGMSETRGKALSGRHYSVLALAAVTFVALGGSVNISRAGGSYGGSALGAGINWFVRYSLFPFLNISSIIDQNGFVWIDNKCYFLSFIIPAALRQDYCSEAKDFLLPVATSPSGFLSPPFTSWGVLGLTVFSFLSGIVVNFIFKRAAVSLSARFLYALMAWALLMIGTYNHFLNAYFMYYPAILFFLIVKFIEEPTPSRRAARSFAT